MQRGDSKEKKREGQGDEGDASRRWLRGELGWGGGWGVGGTCGCTAQESH